MYIWLGIDTDTSLTDLKPHIQKLNQAYGFTPSTLPLHISLKMSFSVENSIAPDVIQALEDFCHTIDAFEIPVSSVDFEQIIIWIRMKENPILNRIHDDLNQLLSEKYGIGLHEYDCDYLFHTTLFMEENTESLKRAYEEIKHIPIPASLPAKKILIGTSPDGSRGSYRVIRHIPLLP